MSNRARASRASDSSDAASRIARRPQWRRTAIAIGALIGTISISALLDTPFDAGSSRTLHADAAPQFAVAQDSTDAKPTEQDGARDDAGAATPSSDSSRDDSTPVPAIEAEDPADATPALERLPFGETLLYRGRVKKAGLTFEAGRANLRVRIDREGMPILEARAHGEKFGYELNTRIITQLDPATLRPTLHLTTERGSERRTKKVVFLEDGADFIRLKHCKDENCGDPSHDVKQAKMHGPIPWGTEKVHCDDTDCKHRAHYAWRTRTEHRYEGTYVDLLSAIYIARQAEFDPSAEPLVIPIISDTRRWKVRVQAKQSKEIEVAAGTFDAVQLVLEPLVADEGKEKEKFQGLFGLNGAIRIWVERSTRRPVLIEGTLPFAFLELHAQIELEEIEFDEELAKAAKERFRDQISELVDGAAVERASAPDESSKNE